MQVGLTANRPEERADVSVEESGDVILERSADDFQGKSSDIIWIPVGFASPASPQYLGCPVPILTTRLVPYGIHGGGPGVSNKTKLKRIEKNTGHPIFFEVSRVRLSLSALPARSESECCMLSTIGHHKILSTQLNIRPDGNRRRPADVHSASWRFAPRRLRQSLTTHDRQWKRYPVHTEKRPGQ